MTNGPVEPSAELRLLASQLRQMYLALIQEGFTEAEAMQIIGVTVAAGITGTQ